MIQGAQNLIARMVYARRDRAIKRAFDTIFLDGDGKPRPEAQVLLGLMRDFCHADTATMHYAPNGTVDPLASAAAEGRRDVWRLFQFYLQVSESELVDIDRAARDELEKARRLKGVFSGDQYDA